MTERAAFLEHLLGFCLAEPWVAPGKGSEWKGILSPSGHLLLRPPAHARAAGTGSPSPSALPAALPAPVRPAHPSSGAVERMVWGLQEAPKSRPVGMMGSHRPEFFFFFFFYLSLEPTQLQNGVLSSV